MNKHTLLNALFGSDTNFTANEALAVMAEQGHEMSMEELGSAHHEYLMNLEANSGRSKIFNKQQAIEDTDADIAVSESLLRMQGGMPGRDEQVMWEEKQHRIHKRISGDDDLAEAHLDMLVDALNRGDMGSAANIELSAQSDGYAFDVGRDEHGVISDVTVRQA